MPFERNMRFTGRELELSRLEELLSPRGQTAKATIVGLGGVGKTQLAIEYVFRSKAKHCDQAVFWIPATDPESLLQAYRTVACELNIPGRDEANADVRRLVQTHLSNAGAGRWLLVYDNADDMDMWVKEPVVSQEARRLIDCIPQSSLGSVLFTTRDRKVAVKLACHGMISLEEMDDVLAISLLQKCLVDGEAGLNQRDAQVLVRRLCHLPLAIIQASAYISANTMPVTDYTMLFEEQDDVALELLSEDFEDKGRYRSIKNPIAATWLISFERILDRDPLAADYLSFMACIEPKEIPLYLLPHGASRKKELDAIGTLTAYSFVALRADRRILDMHRLVHLATRNWLTERGLIEVWSERVVERLEQELVSCDRRNRLGWRNCLPHASHVLALEAGCATEARARLSMSYGLCLFEDGRYEEAQPPIRAAMRMSTDLYGDEDELTVIPMYHLAVLLEHQGQFTEAEQLQVAVLDVRKRFSGEEHPDTLTSMGSLASTYEAQGRWSEAEGLMMDVLRTRKKVLGEDHPDTLRSMAGLASAYGNKGRWVEAEHLATEPLQGRRKVLGDDHPDTLESLHSLAWTYGNQALWAEAESLMLPVLETRRRVLGEEHPDTLSSMANLAWVYGGKGCRKPEWWKEAEQLNVQVMSIRKRVLGDKHPNTLTCMHNLSWTYGRQGRWQEAEQLMRQVTKSRKRVLGEEHPSTLTSMSNLAWMMNNQGRQKEALTLMCDCISLCIQELGEDHPDTVSRVKILGEWKANWQTLPDSG